MKRIFMVTIILLITVNLALADGKQVPAFFNYQGVLIDEGGNPLPDGSTDIKFRVLDSGGGVLYEESQNLDIVKGVVSAMVGNGIDVSSGAPTGGVPESILDPTDSRYLEVEVNGQPPYDKLEIVAVPYAVWSGTALKLPDGAVTSAMIGKGMITKEHLDEELFKTIFPDGIPKTMLPADTVYSGDFEGFRDTVQSSYGAGKVGVTSTFIYSGSQTVQGVLGDLDLAIKKRQEEINFAKNDYGAKVADEAEARGDADKALETADANEANLRSSADTTLQNNIDAEASARQIADTNEASARSSGDGSLQNNINNEAAIRAAGDDALQGQISSHVGATSAHGVSGDIVGTASGQTLLNKTYQGVLSGTMGNHNGLWQSRNPPSGSIVGTTDIQTLSSKKLLSPIIGGGSIIGDVSVNNGVKIDGVNISNHAHAGSSGGGSLYNSAIKFFKGTFDGTGAIILVNNLQYECTSIVSASSIKQTEGLDRICLKDSISVESYGTSVADDDDKILNVSCAAAGDSSGNKGLSSCDTFVSDDFNSSAHGCKAAYLVFCVRL